MSTVQVIADIAMRLDTLKRHSSPDKDRGQISDQSCFERRDKVCIFAFFDNVIVRHVPHARCIALVPNAHGAFTQEGNCHMFRMTMAAMINCAGAFLSSPVGAVFPPAEVCVHGRREEDLLFS